MLSTPSLKTNRSVCPMPWCKYLYSGQSPAPDVTAPPKCGVRKGCTQSAREGPGWQGPVPRSQPASPPLLRFRPVADAHRSVSLPLQAVKRWGCLLHAHTSLSSPWTVRRWPAHKQKKPASPKRGMEGSCPWTETPTLNCDMV